MKLHKRGLLLCACLALPFAAGLQAQNSQVPKTIALADALAAALEQNPSLKAYAYAPRIAEARKIQAGIRPNPVASVEFEDFLGTNDYSGFSDMKTTLMLSQVIDLTGSVDKKVAAAGLYTDLSNAEYEIQRIDLFADIAWKFARVAADAERLELARRAREIGEKTVAAVEERVEAALVHEQELNTAKIALFALKIREDSARTNLQASRWALAALMGESSPSFAAVSARLSALGEIPAFETLPALLENSPVLARFNIETRWQEAQIRFEQSLDRSELVVGGGVRRDNSNDSFGLVAMVSMPLPVRSQVTGNVMEAKQRRAQISAQAQATRLEMHALLYETYSQVQLAKEAFGRLTAESIPLAKETLEMTKEGYQEGYFSLLNLLDAQRTLIELESQAIDNAELFHIQVAALERLLGVSLSASQTITTKL